MTFALWLTSWPDQAYSSHVRVQYLVHTYIYIYTHIHT